MEKTNCSFKILFQSFVLLFILTSRTVIGDSLSTEISIISDPSPGAPVLHGLSKIASSLQSKNISYEMVRSFSEAKGKIVIISGLSTGNGEAAMILKTGNHKVPDVPEALSVWKTSLQSKETWVISGYDDRGLMYALLDVSLRIGWSSDNKDPLSEVKEITEKPDVPERAISFYTMNRAYWESRFYDEKYWKGYLDMLALDRFNSMVVIFGYENGGFLAPCYPYFFDTEGFSDVKMIGISLQEQQKNLNALNKLIRMAHERGIKFSVGIWDHIYRGGVQGGGIPGTKDAPDKPVPGLVWGLNGDNLISYTKASLAKFIKLVPDLDAIQFRMHNESGLKRGEQDAFWSDVFKMMKVTAPDLRLDLRAKELPESVIESALNTGIKFRITTKYWMEQMGMPFHPTQINPEKSERRHSYADMLRYPQQYKMHWRLWNGGTARILLWGDPDYVRRFAKSTHLYDGDGYEVNEPLATKMEAQPHDAKPFNLLNEQYRYYDYEYERYWHFFQVFGRVGYNPDVSSVLWQKEFESRFGKQAGEDIEAALHKASWILPRIVTSVYPYSSFPMTRGWAEKQRLGNLPSYAKNEGSDIQQFANFDEEAQILIEGGATAKILPSVNSIWFGQISSEINKLVDDAEKAAGKSRSKEFISTITDLKILSDLALYHSRRIPAAVSYRIFERTKDVSALNDAINYEEKAIEAWKEIVRSAGDVYTYDLMLGVRTADLCGHWKDELVALEKGLNDLKQKREGYKTEGTIKSAPHFKFASTADLNEKFHVQHVPVTSLPVGKPLKLSVKVADQSGIKSVVLSFRSVNQDMEYQSMPMLNTGVNDTYEGIVPTESINPKWDFMYFIKIIDNEGNGIIYPDLNKETPYYFVKFIR